MRSTLRPKANAQDPKQYNIDPINQTQCTYNIEHERLICNLIRNFLLKR